MTRNYPAARRGCQGPWRRTHFPNGARTAPLPRRGQIVIPALFIFPSLMLFVFLIFETAKLSREKIRHQFAIDAAAFVEMTNYSDFLNRSAYVNGAFPMRIFREGFHDTMLDCLGRDPCPGKRPLDDLLYEDGAFPRSVSEPAREQYTSEEKWDIGYGGLRSGMNSADPVLGEPMKGPGKGVISVNVGSGGGYGTVMTLISLNTAKYWNINWDDANQIYKLYVQIYQLLGSVESAQFSVLKRLSAGHNFLRKSYWLNTGGPEALIEASEAVGSFGRSADGFPGSVAFHCATNILFHGNQLVHSWAQPYQIYASDPPPELPSTIGECRGLFQVVTVKKAVIDGMKNVSGGGYPGWPVEVKWTAPNNYFNVDFNRLMEDGRPRVHATVAIEGKHAAVWPDPTPKFQVRLYP